MTSPRLTFHAIALLVSLATLAPSGCAQPESESAYFGGYTLSQDYELERRVLRIQRDATLEARCMQSSLPIGTSPPWKATVLDPSIHQRLTALIFDETRQPSYRADTEASIEAEVFLCGPRPGGGEFCYVPGVSVLGGTSPWRFGLPPTEVALSAGSLALIDDFRAAHEACWAGGDTR